jgi:hypothetical protein
MLCTAAALGEAEEEEEEGARLLLPLPGCPAELGRTTRSRDGALALPGRLDRSPEEEVFRKWLGLVALLAYPRMGVLGRVPAIEPAATNCS